jgi:hydroxymethylpyrimidine/phosphomethylpyrimidine kinase
MKMKMCWIVKTEVIATSNECVSSMPMLTIVVVMDPVMV